MIKKYIPLIAIISLITAVVLSVICGLYNLQHSFFIWIFIIIFALIYCYLTFKSVVDEVQEIDELSSDDENPTFIKKFEIE